MAYVGVVLVDTILLALFGTRVSPLTLALIKDMAILFSGQGMAVPLTLGVATTPEVVGVMGYGTLET